MRTLVGTPDPEPWPSAGRQGYWAACANTNGSTVATVTLESTPRFQWCPYGTAAGGAAVTWSW